MYGDITKDPAYKAHMMRLQASEYFTVNSKGESVPIHEVAWGTEADDVPTHMISFSLHPVMAERTSVLRATRSMWIM